jgi:predicted transglutaminase-like protease
MGFQSVRFSMYGSNLSLFFLLTIIFPFTEANNISKLLDRDICMLTRIHYLTHSLNSILISPLFELFSVDETIEYSVIDKNHFCASLSDLLWDYVLQKSEFYPEFTAKFHSPQLDYFHEFSQLLCSQSLFNLFFLAFAFEQL